MGHDVCECDATEIGGYETISNLEIEFHEGRLYSAWSTLTVASLGFTGVMC